MELAILQGFLCSPFTSTLLLIWAPQLWWNPDFFFWRARLAPVSQPTTPTQNTDKKALALAERTEFGPLIAFVSPTEALNIEQLFYLMRQNFMAASIKLSAFCSLATKPEFFLKFHSNFFFFFPSDTQTVKMNRTRAFSSRWRETSVANKDDYVEK